MLTTFIILVSLFIGFIIGRIRKYPKEEKKVSFDNSRFLCQHGNSHNTCQRCFDLTYLD